MAISTTYSPRKLCGDIPANEGGGESPDSAAREGGVATIQSLPSIERKDSLWDKTYEAKMFNFQFLDKLKETELSVLK